MKSYTHVKRVFSVSKKETSFSELARWTKVLLIDLIASLLGLSCLTKSLEENVTVRARSTIPARSEPRCGVPRNRIALVFLYRAA
jgi:hypothetical protein